MSVPVNLADFKLKKCFVRLKRHTVDAFLQKEARRRGSAGHDIRSESAKPKKINSKEATTPPPKATRLIVSGIDVGVSIAEFLRLRNCFVVLKRLPANALEMPEGDVLMANPEPGTSKQVLGADPVAVVAEQNQNKIIKRRRAVAISPSTSTCEGETDESDESASEDTEGESKDSADEFENDAQSTPLGRRQIQMAKTPEDARKSPQMHGNHVNGVDAEHESENESMKETETAQHHRVDIGVSDAELRRMRNCFVFLKRLPANVLEMPERNALMANPEPGTSKRLLGTDPMPVASEHSEISMRRRIMHRTENDSDEESNGDSTGSLNTRKGDDATRASPTNGREIEVAKSPKDARESPNRMIERVESHLNGVDAVQESENELVEAAVTVEHRENANATETTASAVTRTVSATKTAVESVGTELPIAEQKNMGETALQQAASAIETAITSNATEPPRNRESAAPNRADGEPPAKKARKSKQKKLMRWDMRRFILKKSEKAKKRHAHTTDETTESDSNNNHKNKSNNENLVAATVPKNSNDSKQTAKRAPLKNVSNRPVEAEAQAHNKSPSMFDVEESLVYDSAPARLTAINEESMANIEF